MAKTLTVAQLIVKLQAVPQDYEVVVHAREKPIRGTNEPGNFACADARSVDVYDAEHAVYIVGQG